MPICFLSPPPSHTDPQLIWRTDALGGRDRNQNDLLRLNYSLFFSIIPSIGVFVLLPSHRNSVFLPRYFLSEEVLFGVYLIDSVAAFLSSEEEKR